MKKLFVFVLFAIVSCIFIPVFADEDKYYIKDISCNYLEEVDNFDDALVLYNNKVDQYDNLQLIRNDKIIKMEYGIVEFVISDDYIKYYSILRNKNDYINGSYGVDAAYLSSKSDNDNIYFVVSGDRGYTNIDNVVLHPYEELDVSISTYVTKQEHLYHNIKTQLQYDHYNTSICLDDIPSCLEEDETYYSYDGHYFYSDFYSMIDDYNDDSYSRAINEEPYYNYYQYLSHRSLTNYSSNELKDYFYDYLGFNNRLIHYVDLDNDYASDEMNRSQLYGNIDDFFVCQYMYGTNAMMLISSAIVESNYGKSLNSFINNNLYLNAAFDSAVENENKSYNCVSNSIHSHSRYYISGQYGNHLKSSYSGTYYGNKLGGINIENSIDHYYGEKCAAAYYKMDSDLGYKDKDSNCYGIINNEKTTLYKDKDLSDRLIVLQQKSVLSFPIIEETDDSYLIQIDYSFSDEYLYDFSNSVAYVKKDAFDAIINEEKMHKYDLNRINYDFNGGAYHGYDKLSYKVLSNVEYPNVVPTKKECEFVEYKQIVEDDGSNVYVSHYKQIATINYNHLFEKQRQLVPYPDYSNAKIAVTYLDASTKTVPINSDMVSKYNYESFDTQSITISYNGIKLNKDIQIDETYYESLDNFIKALDNNDCYYIKHNIDTVYYPLQMNQIRKIDYTLKQDNKRNYVIIDKNNKYNLSVSGLDMSLNDRKNFNLIDDTYYVEINNARIHNVDRIKKISKGYGFDYETSLNISFRFNYQKIDLIGPAIVQIDLPDKKTDYIYSVYHTNSNGDIVKCRTTQSENFIQFIINEAGDYCVLSMPSVNNFGIDDGVEDLSYENMGFDNNRTNIEFLFALILVLLCVTGIIVYYYYLDKKEKTWKDYKKSLLKVDIVLEEKQKN